MNSDSVADLQSIGKPAHAHFPTSGAKVHAFQLIYQLQITFLRFLNRTCHLRWFESLELIPKSSELRFGGIIIIFDDPGNVEVKMEVIQKICILGEIPL